jgi:hypothetical protein
MNRSQLLKILIGGVVICIVFRILCKKSQHSQETFAMWAGPQTWETIPPGAMSTPRPIATATPMPQQMVTSTPGPLATSVALLPQTSPAPKPGQTSWAEFAPQTLDGQQLLEPSKFIGVDTQGSTLRNASWDLRRDPPVPRVDVGPWIQSTIDADPFRKPLDDCT